MPEPNFHALRQVLEADVAPPPFAAIVDRRRRRTQRRAIAGVVLATAAVVAAGLALRPTHPVKPEPLVPPVPTVRLSPTAMPSATDTAAPVPAPGPNVAAIAAAPSGTLYAIAGTCPVTCTDAHPTYHFSLIRSTDLGGHWTSTGPLAGAYPAAAAQHLLVADDTHLWIVTDSALLATSDAGQHWRSTSLPAASGTGDQLAGAAVAGGTAWVLTGTRVLRATAGDGRGPGDRARYHR